MEARITERITLLFAALRTPEKLFLNVNFCPRMEEGVIEGRADMTASVASRVPLSTQNENFTVSNACSNCNKLPSNPPHNSLKAMDKEPVHSRVEEFRDLSMLLTSLPPCPGHIMYVVSSFISKSARKPPIMGSRGFMRANTYPSTKTSKISI